MDLKDAYSLISLGNLYSAVMAVNTQLGLFQYNVLFFGLGVSSDVFLKTLNHINNGLVGAGMHQNDVGLFVVSPFTLSPSIPNIFYWGHNFHVCSYLLGFSSVPASISLLSSFPSSTSAHEFRPVHCGPEYCSWFVPVSSPNAVYLAYISSSNTPSCSGFHEKMLRVYRMCFGRTLSSSHIHLRDISQLSLIHFRKEISAVLKQRDIPVICISRRLLNTNIGYQQIRRKVLGVHWSVRCIHKVWFEIHFTKVGELEALKYIYHPRQSVSKTSATLVPSWSTTPIYYNYEINIHRRIFWFSVQNDQSIQYIWWRRSFLSAESTHKTSWTCTWYAKVICSHIICFVYNKKWRSPVLFSHRDRLSVTHSEVFCYKDRIVILPNPSSSVRADFHPLHLIIDKMKSLERINSPWHELNPDIGKIVKNGGKFLHKMVFLDSWRLRQ